MRSNMRTGGLVSGWAFWVLALWTIVGAVQPGVWGADGTAAATADTAESDPKDLTGTWLGPLKVGPIELRLALKLRLSDSGQLTATLDSIDQGAKDLPVDTVTFQDGELTAELKAIGGKFVGKLTDDGQSFEGTWTQGPQSLPLTLKKTDGELQLKRPQEPHGPYPYQVVEVTFENTADQVQLAGTLTLPQGNGPFPAVLLVSGSGPQDRDESLMGHKPFHVLADHLTRQGIAVLRYDDRGVGQSKGKFEPATTADFSRDALAGLRFLSQRSDIDQRKLGVCGHSEGGLIAPLLAVESAEVSFIVLLAGPGVPGTEILYRQGELIAKSMGADDAAIQTNVQIQKQLFEHMREDSSADGVKAKFQELVDAIADAQVRELAAKSIEGQLAVLNSPWFRHFLFYDPRPTLRQVKCPVLAINGEKDLQVEPAQNLPEIKAALVAGGNEHVAIHELPGLNHLFQTCKTGAISEYSQIEETMSPEVLQLVSDWILSTTKTAAN